MQNPVTQSLWFCFGQVAVQGDEPQPGQQGSGVLDQDFIDMMLTLEVLFLTGCCGQGGNRPGNA
jgi:hypothetical protein